eukprot:2186974-Pleurochrysis_carterae.AAC.4
MHRCRFDACISAISTHASLPFRRMHLCLVDAPQIGPGPLSTAACARRMCSSCPPSWPRASSGAHRCARRPSCAKCARARPPVCGR